MSRRMLWAAALLPLMAGCSDSSGPEEQIVGAYCRDDQVSTATRVGDAWNVRVFADVTEQDGNVQRRSCQEAVCHGLSVTLFPTASAAINECARLTGLT